MATIYILIDFSPKLIPVDNWLIRSFKIENETLQGFHKTIWVKIGNIDLSFIASAL